MPAVITHYLFANACADTLAESGVLTAVRRHGDVFSLGAQGPDILFFAIGNKAMNQLGGRMHHEGINAFFAECINRLRKTPEHEGRSELTAYMAGFLCHYALDTCAHPYVYYKTGFSDEAGSLSGEPAVRHHFLETTIDCILSEKTEYKNPYLLNISEKISIGAKQRAAAGEFLSETINAAYGVYMYPEDYIKAMKDIAFVYRALRDRSGKKRQVLHFLGRASRMVDALAAMIHYEPVKRLDYMNEQRGVWYYPWDNSIDLNFSFMDLYEKAVEDSRIYINAFMNAIDRKIDDKIALSILGGKNFSTGLESPVKFLYYNIEYDKFVKE